MAQAALPFVRHADRVPVLACCDACKHVWPIVWTPCDMSLMASVGAKVCPWCGTKKPGNILVASAKSGDLMRYAKWLGDELSRAVTAAFPKKEPPDAG